MRRRIDLCFTVLEEDYERKRWERKVAKMRGRPRKRRRREVCFI